MHKSCVNLMAKFEKGHKKIPGSGMKLGQKTEKVQAWEELGNYFCNEGAQKYLSYITSLNGEVFARRYESMAEYFKSKQARHEVRYEHQTDPALLEAIAKAFDLPDYSPLDDL